MQSLNHSSNLLTIKKVVQSKQGSFTTTNHHIKKILSLYSTAGQKKEALIFLLKLIGKLQEKGHSFRVEDIPVPAWLEPVTNYIYENQIFGHIYSMCEHRYFACLSGYEPNRAALESVCALHKFYPKVHFTKTATLLIDGIIEEYQSISKENALFIDTTQKSEMSSLYSEQELLDDDFVLVDGSNSSVGTNVIEECSSMMIESIVQKVTQCGGILERMEALKKAKDSVCALMQYIQDESNKPQQTILKVDMYHFEDMGLVDTAKQAFLLRKICMLCNSKRYSSGRLKKESPFYAFRDTLFTKPANKLIDKFLGDHFAISFTIGCVTAYEGFKSWAYSTSTSTAKSFVCTVGVTSVVATGVILGGGLTLFPASGVVVCGVVTPSLVVPVAYFHSTAWRAWMSLQESILMPTLRAAGNMLALGGNITLHTNSASYFPGITTVINLGKGTIKNWGMVSQKFRPVTFKD